MTSVLFEEQSLRDGLQNETRELELQQKLSLYRSLREAGLQRIQLGSFVNPRRVPQMADTDELVQQIGDEPGVVLTALVLNATGLERALRCGLKHLTLSISISEAHSQKNVGKSSATALAEILPLITEAVAQGVTVRAGIQCAFGGVDEEEIAPRKVFDAAEAMLAAGACECNLADTAGVAYPAQVEALVEDFSRHFPTPLLSLHLHDTRGLAMANLVAGFAAGVRLFDTSTGGLGGCPFVPDAAGNIATEDAAHLFAQMGVSTGVDLPRLCATTRLYQRLLARKLPGRICAVLARSKPAAKEF